MEISTLIKTFEGSTINIDAVIAFLKSDPGYGKTVDPESGTWEKIFLNEVDTFVLHFRFYVLDRYKEPKETFQAIDMLLQIDEEQARSLLPLVMDSVLETFHLNEWWELMPRYTLARQQIEERFGIEQKGELARMITE